MRDELIPSDPLWTPSRVLSLLLAAAYVVGACFLGGVEGVVNAGMFVVLPLGCIWFGDVLGDYTGYGLSRVAITKTSPGVFVYYLGWVVLLLPLLVVVYFKVVLPAPSP